MATEASHLSGSRVTSQIVLNMLFMMASLLIFVILHVGYLRDLSLAPHFFIAYMNDIFNVSEFLFTVIR